MTIVFNNIVSKMLEYHIEKESKTGYTKTMKYKLHFKGNEWSFFGYNLLFWLLILATFGIATPFYVYWMVKYFIVNTEVTATPKSN